MSCEYRGLGDENVVAYDLDGAHMVLHRAAPCCTVLLVLHRADPPDLQHRSETVSGPAQLYRALKLAHVRLPPTQRTVRASRNSWTTSSFLFNSGDDTQHLNPQQPPKVHEEHLPDSPAPSKSACCHACLHTKEMGLVSRL